MTERPDSPESGAARACLEQAPALTLGSGPGPIARLTRWRLHLRMVRKARAGDYDERMFAYWDVDPYVNGGCQRAVRRGTAANLVPTSSRRWPVGTGSYHNARNDKGEGKAVDLGNVARHVGPTAKGRRRLIAYQLAEFKAWQRGDRRRMIELIGPDNDAVVLRRRHQPLPNRSPLEDQHDNHVHQAFDD